VVAWHGDHLEALVLAGRPWSAQTAVDDLAELAERSGRAWAHGVVWRIRAMLASGSERAACYEQALAWNETFGSPFERARTLLCRGRDLRADGDRVGTDLSEAARAFDRIGAVRWAALARSLLDDGATRPATACRRSIERELSCAELRVADVVARGLTNRETASELFVSVKTVDFHLQNIYRKLGVRSRTELARRVAS
jgi:DNA-binding CsgD family transcriptional regulator